MDTMPDELLDMLSVRIGDGPKPVSDQILDKACDQLDRPLPRDLRQIYKLADGGWGPGDGFLPLASAVDKYRTLISEPFGPLDEPWPENLLPLYEEDRVPVCYDLATGKIIAWEADRIEDTERVGAFAASFVEEAASLSELLSSWLETDGFEQMRERMWGETMDRANRRGVSPVTGFPNQFDDPNEQAEGEIAFLAQLPEMRADLGLPEADWQAEVRRRHGLPTQ